MKPPTSELQPILSRYWIPLEFERSINIDVIKFSEYLENYQSHYGVFASVEGIYSVPLIFPHTASFLILVLILLPFPGIFL